jgi:predicted site-specific integrase-resolvase
MATMHLNQQALAERWCVSEATLERWRSVGIGPVYLKMHGRVTYRECDIEEFESSCLHKSTHEKVVGASHELSPTQSSQSIHPTASA